MKRIFATILVLLVILSLAACGAGGNAAGAPTDGLYNNDELYKTERSDYIYGDTPMAALAPEAAYDSGMVYEEAEAQSVSMGGGSSINDGRKITFSASISLNTKEFDADYVKIYQLIENSGGYIASENMYDNSAEYGRLVGRIAYITARVPAGGYNTFIDAISGVGEVTQKSKWSEDLTSEYFDTDARIDLLELRKERLMNYLLEAENAEDIVAFERELSDVLYDLDYYQGNMRRLDRLVDYASVDINLTELITPDTIGKDGEPLGARASDAFSLSMTGVGRFLENAAIFFAGAAPILILLVVIALIVWAIVRLTRPLREKLRAKREARPKREKQEKYPAYNAQYWQQQGYQPPPGPQPSQTPPQPQAPPPAEPEETPRDK